MSNARVYINEKTNSQSFTVIINRGFVEGIIGYCMDRGICYERQMMVKSERLNGKYYDEIYRLIIFLLAQNTEIYIRARKSDDWTGIASLEDFDRYVEEKSLPARVEEMRCCYIWEKNRITRERSAQAASEQNPFCPLPISDLSHHRAVKRRYHEI